MEFYERLTGARLHANVIRPGGLLHDITPEFLNDIQRFCIQLVSRVDEIEELLTSNRI